jgi:hypothetical protein
MSAAGASAAIGWRTRLIVDIAAIEGARDEWLAQRHAGEAATQTRLTSLSDQTSATKPKDFRRLAFGQSTTTDSLTLGAVRIIPN